MYQTIGEDHIGETISVIGIYTPGHFFPKKLKWRGKILPIDQVCSVHDFKDGGVRKRRFSIMSGPTVYLIEFNRDFETWSLLQVWVE